MSLKTLILVESLVFGIFSGLILFLTKFVDYLEVETYLAVTVSDCFFCAAFGIVLILILTRRQNHDKKIAKRVVSKVSYGHAVPWK